MLGVKRPVSALGQRGVAAARNTAIQAPADAAVFAAATLLVYAAATALLLCVVGLATAEAGCRVHRLVCCGHCRSQGHCTRHNGHHPLALPLISVRYFLAAASLGALVDTLWRARDLRTFYTDDGVFPSATYAQTCTTLGVCDFDFRGDPAHRTHLDHSLHLLSGEFGIQALLFAGTAILAAGTAGRILFLSHRGNTGDAATLRSVAPALLALYVLVSSMHRRNHWVVDKGSTTLRVLLLWAMLLSFSSSLPLSSSSSTGTTRVLLSPATAGFVMQVALVYWFSALYKYRPPDHPGDRSIWGDGTALEASLRLKTQATLIGGLLLANVPATGLAAMTHASGLIEALGPCMLFVPAASRGPVVLMFVGFHTAIAASMSIGIFPLYSCLLFVPFVPARWWPGGGAAAAYDEEDKAGERPEQHQHEEGGEQAAARVGESKDGLRPTLWRAGHGFLVLVVSLLIFWWQAFHFELSGGMLEGDSDLSSSWFAGAVDSVSWWRSMPQPVKEACAVLGLKQHWKVFTGIAPPEEDKGNGDDTPELAAYRQDCRFMFIGVMPKDAVPEGHPPYVNLLRWERDYSHDDEDNNAQWDAVSFPTLNDTLWDSARVAPLADMPSFLWSLWMDGSQANDYNLAATGRYFCQRWEARRKVRLNVTFDGTPRTLRYTFLETKARAVQWCRMVDLSNIDCQRLYDAMLEWARRSRLESWMALNVCRGGRVTGQSRKCDGEWAKPEALPAPQRLEFAVPGLV